MHRVERKNATVRQGDDTRGAYNSSPGRTSRYGRRRFINDAFRKRKYALNPRYTADVCRKRGCQVRDTDALFMQHRKVFRRNTKWSRGPASFVVISLDNYPAGRRDSRVPFQATGTLGQPVVVVVAVLVVVVVVVAGPVVIVVSRFKVRASPLTRNLRLTGADSISSRSTNARRTFALFITNSRIPNSK